MSSKEFQNGHHGGYLGYSNQMILAVLNLHVALMPPTKFQLKLTYSLAGDMIWISRCHHGGHLGHRNVTILAVLNHHVRSMPPIKFQLNLTLKVQEEMFFERFQVVQQARHLEYLEKMWKMWKVTDGWTNWSWSTDHSISWLFKMAWGSAWISWQNGFSNSESPCHPNAPNQVLA